MSALEFWSRQFLAVACAIGVFLLILIPIELLFDPGLWFLAITIPLGFALGLAASRIERRTR